MIGIGTKKKEAIRVNFKRELLLTPVLDFLRRVFGYVMTFSFFKLDRIFEQFMQIFQRLKAWGNSNWAQIGDFTLIFSVYAQRVPFLKIIVQRSV